MDLLREAAEIHNRSIAAQAEHWMRLGRSFEAAANHEVVQSTLRKQLERDRLPAEIRRAIQAVVDEHAAGLAGNPNAPASEGRPIPSTVRGVVARGFVEVKLVVGSSARPRLTVQCGKAADLPSVKTSVSKDVLFVDFQEGSYIIGSDYRHGRTVQQVFSGAIISGVSGRRGVQDSGNGLGAPIVLDAIPIVEVELPDLHSIELIGSGDLDCRCEGDLGRLNVSLVGSGDVSLKGRLQTLNVELAGSGDVDASDLSVPNANLRLTGSGDITACVTEAVKVSLSGSGDIIVSGRPHGRETRVSGSGEVKFRE